MPSGKGIRLDWFFLYSDGSKPNRVADLINHRRDRAQGFRW
jgi:hypothetical protein